MGSMEGHGTGVRRADVELDPGIRISGAECPGMTSIPRADPGTRLLG
jgi:hypothetical protein